MSRSRRPEPSEYAPFYGAYVAAVPEGDVVDLLALHGRSLVSILNAVPDALGGHRYAEGKWSVREVVGHVSDAERIFTYRALRIARGDRTPLPGFEENSYVAHAGSDARALGSLTDELRVVREGTVTLFASLDDAAWAREGVASECRISVRALACITLGHSLHHLRILRERYGLDETSARGT